MATSTHLNPGMIIQIGKKIYRVESAVKVTPPKGSPFIKTKICDVSTNKVMEKNFKPNQTVQEVPMGETQIEFLYMEGKDYLFLDVNTLEQYPISPQTVGISANYLKEGVLLRGLVHEGNIFSVELPQFLELMVANVQEIKKSGGQSRLAILETGAEIEVPSFIEVGDIIKVDTKTDDYIQRV